MSTVAQDQRGVAAEKSPTYDDSGGTHSSTSQNPWPEDPLAGFSTAELYNSRSCLPDRAILCGLQDARATPATPFATVSGVDALVGSTGFVGGHLQRAHRFDLSVHRSDVGELTGRHVDLLVCAGLPAAKWLANKDPQADWSNMAALAKVLATVRPARAVLISTIDVYQPAVDVDESDPPDFDAPGAYGAHRAWFETFFQARFPGSTVLRLPGLFGPDLRKNLIYDLLHGRRDQWQAMNPESRFQFFDATRTWDVVEQAWRHGLSLVNVTSEPVSAQQISALFAVELRGTSPAVSYDMRSLHAERFGGSDGYIFSARQVLRQIDDLRRASVQ